MFIKIPVYKVRSKEDGRFLALKQIILNDPQYVYDFGIRIAYIKYNQLAALMRVSRALAFERFAF